MPHHIRVVLPEGTRVTADWRESVVRAMRRYAKAVSVDHKEPREADVEAIRAWHQVHAAQSAQCYQGQCDHD